MKRPAELSQEQLALQARLEAVEQTRKAKHAYEKRPRGIGLFGAEPVDLNAAFFQSMEVKAPAPSSTK